MNLSKLVKAHALAGIAALTIGAAPLSDYKHPYGKNVCIELLPPEAIAINYDKDCDGKYELKLLYKIEKIAGNYVFGELFAKLEDKNHDGIFQDEEKEIVNFPGKKQEIRYNGRF